MGRPLAVSMANSCRDLSSGGSDPQTAAVHFLGEGGPFIYNPKSIKVTLSARRGAWVGEEVVAGEDTKMTALEELRASCAFSLPSPQVRLASLHSEV